MHPSRSLDRRILVLVAGVSLLAACSAGPAPSGVISTASASATASIALASSAAPASSASSAVGDPAESVEPAGDPSSELTETAPPADPANPTAKPVPPPPADCGTGKDAFFALRDQVPAQLQFGGATLEFTTAMIGMRDGSYTADDAIPGGVGLSPNEIAVRVDPATHVILRGSGTSLTDLSAAVVAWSSVVFEGGLGSSGDMASPLGWSFRSGGTISVTAPSEPGDYMVTFDVHWFTHCLVGDGVAYGRIKVNG